MWEIFREFVSILEHHSNKLSVWFHHVDLGDEIVKPIKIPIQFDRFWRVGEIVISNIIYTFVHRT